jgi:hypothetical protein
MFSGCQYNQEFTGVLLDGKTIANATDALIDLDSEEVSKLANYIDTNNNSAIMDLVTDSYLVPIATTLWETEVAVATTTQMIAQGTAMSDIGQNSISLVTQQLKDIIPSSNTADTAKYVSSLMGYDANSVIPKFEDLNSTDKAKIILAYLKGLKLSCTVTQLTVSQLDKLYSQYGIAKATQVNDKDKDTYISDKIQEFDLTKIGQDVLNSIQTEEQEVQTQENQTQVN